MRQDTYMIVRQIHRRYGARGGVLFLYQRDLARLVEGPGLPVFR